jgi:methylated-DNA-[protein]-cysteine S-methyltransferase
MDVGTSNRALVLAVADGPWGPVRIAAGPDGLVAVAVLSSAEAFAADLDRRRRGSLTPVEDAAPGPARDLALRTRDAIEALLAGEPVDAGALPVDLGDRSPWDRLVLDGVRSIPRGEVASYGEVARRIGRAGAARAVGGAVGRNPVGLVVPCHRVIAGDGTLGGYGVAAWGGREAALEVKRALLALEGVSVG